MIWGFCSCLDSVSDMVVWLCCKMGNGNVNLYKKATCGVLCLSFYVSLHMKLAEFWFKKSDACK